MSKGLKQVDIVSKGSSSLVLQFGNRKQIHPAALFSRSPQNSSYTSEREKVSTHSSDLNAKQLGVTIS